jgi:hypothetical protein
MGLVALRGGRHAQSARDGVGRPVEDDREGQEQVIEEPHKRGDEERGPFGLLDGERLGRELAEDHVQERGDEQRQRDGYGVQERSRDAKRPQDGLDQGRYRGLRQGADAKRADRDPELADR